MTGTRYTAHRIAVIVMALGAWSEPAMAGHFMTADVILNRRPPMNPGDLLANEPDVQSTGYVEVISTVYNEVDFSAHISGNHWIHESESRASIVASHRIDTYGTYNNGSVRSSTDFGSCYRASLTATSVDDAHAEMQSNEVCADGDPMSPVILDLDSDGFHLGGLVDAVEFDLDADGTKDRVTWTRADQLDAFLCRDRNGNGVIDDGAELFGNHTVTASGVTVENGYLVLLELDDPALGGDGDGYVGPGDEGFSDLRVWIDANHDGVSDPSELWGLPQVGVVRLDPRYVAQRRSDRNGNLFRYRSKAWTTSPGAGERVIQTADVFLFVE